MAYGFALRRDKLLLLTLIALFYAYSTYIRVALRSIFEGTDFSWAYYAGLTRSNAPAVARGEGLYGHTDYILLNALVLAWLLCVGLRKPDRYFQAALLGWTVLGAGISIWMTNELGESLTTSKETLGLSNLSHFWTNVVPNLVSALLALALLFRGAPPRPAADAVWTRLNSLLLAFGLGALILSALLLNMGPQHGPLDFNGIGAMYMGLLALLLGVAPWDSAGAPLQAGSNGFD